QRAVSGPDRQVTVDQGDRRNLQRIVNNLRLGEFSEGIYAVKSATMWWTGHLLKQAKTQGDTDRFPVAVLRQLTDRPAPRGLDKAVQNLVIAVFALDQDLSWYQDGTRVTAPGLDGIADDLELRTSRLPDETTWKIGRERAAVLLGVTVPALRNAPNLATAARQVRDRARGFLPDTRLLVRLLGRHAGLLGIDVAAPTGRLATARGLGRLLARLAPEADDAVLVDALAGHALGNGVEPEAASRYLAGAKAQTDALARTPWSVLTVLAAQQGDAAAVVLDTLRDTARREDLSADLVAGLRAAIAEAERLLAQPTPRR